jgi:proline iminopeptidase
MLKVSDVHQIYWEECGNPEGSPVLVIHGGPGGGCDATMRRYFHPQQYRIILFDQRGAGRSLPFASLEDNTTQHLIADMEKLRELLKVEKWHCFGGSWGSTLQLAYCIAHPDRILSMTLRGIFLLRKRDIQVGCFV